MNTDRTAISFTLICNAISTQSDSSSLIPTHILTPTLLYADIRKALGSSSVHNNGRPTISAPQEVEAMLNDRSVVAGAQASSGTNSIIGASDNEIQQEVTRSGSVNEAVNLSLSGPPDATASTSVRAWSFTLFDIQSPARLRMVWSVLDCSVLQILHATPHISSTLINVSDVRR